MMSLETIGSSSYCRIPAHSAAEDAVLITSFTAVTETGSAAGTEPRHVFDVVQPIWIPPVNPTEPPPRNGVRRLNAVGISNGL